MAQSSIEWTDAVWNPVTGCTKVSQGCKDCYAERMAKRFAGMNGYPADDPFRVTLHPDRLDLPLRWKRRRRIFVNSMSDLFHPDVPEAFIRDVWAIMAQAHQHTFQVLTKRPERMAEVLHRMDLQDLAPPGPLPNVWVGVSVEDQGTADGRIPHLLRTPAAVRWISAEPLLGPVDLTHLARRPDYDPAWTYYDNALTGFKATRAGGWNSGKRLDWVVVGGESGPDARPMQTDWARSLRNQCTEAGVPFLFKQWGTWLPMDHDPEIHLHPGQGRANKAADGSPGVWRRAGKQAAGRLLDGVLHDEYPEVRHG